MVEYLVGSVEGFVDRMNVKVKELNMNDIYFVNINGFLVVNYYIFVYDIVLMFRELLKYEMISKYLIIWMDKVVVGKK